LASNVGRFSILPASVCDISSVGVEDEKMTKQELIQAAREIMEICKEQQENNANCLRCPFSYVIHDGISIGCGFDSIFPCDWNIEDLEREE
jgi:hypothetical protein